MKYTPIRHLPNGAIKKVAKAMGYSESLVSAVAHGKRRNVRVYESLLILAKEEERRIKRMERWKRMADERKRKDETK